MSAGAVIRSNTVCQNQGKVRENEIVLAYILENVDIAYFISIYFQRVRVISVTFCYTADKLEIVKNILSQGKVKLKIMATLLNNAK